MSRHKSGDITGEPETSSDLKDFPAKLLELRLGRRESQRDLADAIGSHQQNVWRWEKGGGEPTRSQWIALGAHYGVPLEYLLDDAIQDATPREGLTTDELRLLDLIRKIGVSRSEARLLQIGEPAEPSVPASRGSLAIEREAVEIPGTPIVISKVKVVRRGKTAPPPAPEHVDEPPADVIVHAVPIEQAPRRGKTNGGA